VSIFFRIYVDRTHHGKEEDILFRELAKKELSVEHKTIMNNLLEDHKFARKTVGPLDEANVSFIRFNIESMKEIKLNLEKLITLYQRHIYTE